LRLDPVHGLAVARRALPAIAERGQALDGGLVFFEIQAPDQRADRIGRWRRRLLRREGKGGKSHGEAQ
jgi:hypothetical protein